MVRKFGIFLVLAGIAAGVLFLWFYYGVVFYFDVKSPRVTHVYVVRKPERGPDVFFNHSYRRESESEIARLKEQGKPIPWHLDHDEVQGASVYYMTMDSKASPSGKNEASGTRMI